MRRVTEEHKDNLFFYLTFLRLFPGSPNWVMNITFPHIGISAKQVYFSVLLGLMPWNLLTVEAGEVLSTITSKSDILTTEVYIKLIGMAFLFLLPPILKKLCMKPK